MDLVRYARRSAAAGHEACERLLQLRDADGRLPERDRATAQALVESLEAGLAERAKKNR